MTGQRAVLGAVAGLLVAVLSGCAHAAACTEAAAVTEVRVVTTALALPAEATGRLCLDDECTDVVLGEDGTYPYGVGWGRPIPDAETVQVSLTLTDLAGTQLWSGSATVDTDVVEPNGPGCGQTTVLPALRATPDGRLTT